MKNVRIFLILSFIFIVLQTGCANNKCHETCYTSITEQNEKIQGSVIYWPSSEDNLEYITQEHFPEYIIIGKSYFSSPSVKIKNLKKFAKKIGANLVLCHSFVERAGLKNECSCNPIVEDKEILSTSTSVSAGGSAAVGPGAAYIFNHKVWFLYKKNQGKPSEVLEILNHPK